MEMCFMTSALPAYKTGPLACFKIPVPISNNCREF